MPRITDIFILKELRKASLLLAIFQICGKTTPSQTPGEGNQEKENTPFKLNSMNQSGSVRLKMQVFKNVIVLFILGKWADKLSAGNSLTATEPTTEQELNLFSWYLKGAGEKRLYP